MDLSNVTVEVGSVRPARVSLDSCESQEDTRSVTSPNPYKKRKAANGPPIAMLKREEVPSRVTPLLAISGNIICVDSPVVGGGTLQSPIIIDDEPAESGGPARLAPFPSPQRSSSSLIRLDNSSLHHDGTFGNPIVLEEEDTIVNIEPRHPVPTKVEAAAFASSATVAPPNNPEPSTASIDPTPAVHKKVDKKVAPLVEPFGFTLVKVPVQAYVEATVSEREGDFLYKLLCEKLAVDPVTKRIPSSYDSKGEEYFQARKALVIEEAREVISRSLAALWSTKTKRDPAMELILDVKDLGKAEPDKVITVTFHRPFPEDRNERPNWFTKQEKEFLITGSLFECSPVSDMKSIENTMLAVVLSTHPKRINKEMEFDVKISSNMVNHGKTWRLTHLDTIISLEREFEALDRNPATIAFLPALLGNNAISCKEDGDTMGADEKPLEDADTPERAVPILPKQIKLKDLNAAQEVAVSSFLGAAKNSISIVQGPPGTGKTTLLVSAISRHLLSDENSRVLVCAPTNKAVSLLALRFLEAVSKARVNIILVGDDHKLLEESGGRNSPLHPFFVYNWSYVIVQEYEKIRQYCSAKQEPEATAESMWKRSVVLRDRLLGCLLGLPPDFTGKVNKLCTVLERCVNGTALRNSGIALVKGILSTFSDFPVDTVRTQILNSAHVIFSTLCSTGGSAMIKMTKPVDSLIVDEAAAATEPAMCIAFRHRPSKLLIVGDPKQLPATVISKRATRLGLSLSLHERLMYGCSYPYTMLNIQYRMHPEISHFPSAHFYQGQVNNGGNVTGPSHHGKALLLTRQPYVFWQVRGADGQSESGSRFNSLEADAVVMLVESLRDTHNLAWCNDSEHLRIITFYQAQVSLLRKKLAKKNMRNVLVATVDSSQGCEADVVLVSFVRSGNTPGFLVDDRRMNVALTRARHQLVCVGNVEGFAHMQNANTLRRLNHDAVARKSISRAAAASVNSGLPSWDE